MDKSSRAMAPRPKGAAIWIVLVCAASVAFSLAFACATPFAALATVSGLGLRRRQALALVGLSWLANQAVGYGVLHYPRTPDSLAWGAVIGFAALAATLVVSTLRQAAAPMLRWGVGFALAFVAYEGVLFAATALLPSGEGAFAPAVVGRILLLHLVALIGLAVLHRAALATRLLPPAGPRLAAA